MVPVLYHRFFRSSRSVSTGFDIEPLEATHSLIVAEMFQLSDGKVFSLHTEWLLLDSAGPSSGVSPSTQRKLSEAYILPGSSVTISRLHPHSQMVEYYNAYRNALWTNMKYILLSRQVVGLPSPLSQRGRRTDFEGVTYRSAIIVSDRNIHEHMSQ